MTFRPELDYAHRFSPGRNGLYIFMPVVAMPLITNLCSPMYTRIIGMVAIAVAAISGPNAIW